MMYLLFWLLNIAWLIGCIILCIKATKYIKERFGVLIALLFVFFLLSFAGYGSNDKPQTLVWKTSDSSALQTVTYFKEQMRAPLEDNLMFTVNLHVTKGYDNERATKQPLSAYAGLEGFTGGYEWQPQDIMIDTENGTATYEVHAIMKWRLFGIFEYSQPKVYKGILELK